MTTFKFLVEGLFPKEDIIITKTNNTMVKPRFLEEEIIEPEFRWVNERRRIRGLPEAWPGPMCRLERWEVKNGKLYLTLGNTDYKDFIGLRSVGQDVIDLLGYEYFPNTLAVCSSVKTKDGKIILLRRSSQNAEYPRWIHTYGGHPSVEKKDVYNGMQMELIKERGIKPEDIHEMVSTGMVMNYITKKPEVTFKTILKKTASELEAIPCAEERGEHELIAMEKGKKSYAMYIDNSPTELASALYRHDRIFVPPGQGALWRYGKLEFGDEWGKEVMYNLTQMWLKRSFDKTIRERDHSEDITLEYGLI